MWGLAAMPAPIHFRAAASRRGGPPGEVRNRAADNFFKIAGNQGAAARSTRQVGDGDRAGRSGGREGVAKVLKIAAFLIASAAGSLAAAATTTADSMLVSNAPWWEKVTVTMSGDGNPQSCSYTTSLKPSAVEHCDVASEAAAMTKASAHDSTGAVTRITFERRFNPGAEPAKPELAAGDTLLGGQIMALNIDKLGKVKGCKVIARSGSMTPEYSCDDAAAERFQAGLATAQAPERQGYMTVIVYGHSEHMV